MNFKFKNVWYDINMDELEEIADQVELLYGCPVHVKVLDHEDYNYPELDNTQSESGGRGGRE